MVCYVVLFFLEVTDYRHNFNTCSSTEIIYLSLCKIYHKSFKKFMHFIWVFKFVDTEPMIFLIIPLMSMRLEPIIFFIIMPMPMRSAMMIPVSILILVLCDFTVLFELIWLEGHHIYWSFQRIHFLLFSISLVYWYFLLFSYVHFALNFLLLLVF